MNYRARIAQIAAELGYNGIDPRHIEAWIRSENETLDALRESRIVREVAIGCECVLASGVEMSERLAQSYGI